MGVRERFQRLGFGLMETPADWDIKGPVAEEQAGRRWRSKGGLCLIKKAGVEKKFEGAERSVMTS